MGVGLIISVLLVLTAPREDFVTSMAQATTTVALKTTTGGTKAAVSPTTTISMTDEGCSPSVTLKATLEEPFVEELTNRTSPRFKTLEAITIHTCDGIYKARFGFRFIRTLVIGFSPATANYRISNTAAEVRLLFNSSVPSALLPTSDDVAQTLVDAILDPNSTLNVSILVNSVQVLGATFPGATAGSTATGASTATGRTAAAAVNATTSVPCTTEVPPPSVDLRATLEKAFVPQFMNSSSEEFRRLEATVTRLCDGIYKARFGILFIRTLVIGFSSAPGNAGTINTAAEVRLLFNSSVPPALLPTSDDVAQTLVDAILDTNCTLNVSILVNSVQVLGSTIPGSTITTQISTTIYTKNGRTTSDGSTSGVATTTFLSTTGETTTTTAGSTTTGRKTTGTAGSTATSRTTTTTAGSTTTGRKTTGTAGSTTGRKTTTAGSTTTGRKTTGTAGSTTTAVGNISITFNQYPITFNLQLISLIIAHAIII